MATTDSQTGSPQTATNGHRDPASRPPDDLTIVGIAAATGGLVPLRTFLAALPPDTGMTFVVVTQLAPDQERALPDLLRSAATLPVTQVRTRAALAHNHIYIIPTDKRVLVAAGHLELVELEPMQEQRLQIDLFFRTLAEQHGDGAAVILSGAGSGGALGIRAIKDKGGLLLVQAPEEAEHDAMPRNAIATGLVDAVAPAADLAALLVAAKRTQAQLQLPQDAHGLAPTDQHILAEIVAQLQQRTGHDLGGYKEATILRRVGRRMQVVQVATLAEYLDRMWGDAVEAEALYRDVLIHVTEFFRDAEAWEVLARVAIPQIFAAKAPGEPVRVWAAGCATGEEAYSVAMLLKEYADRLERRIEIQVFASDLGRAVLDFARNGVYPEAIAADVSPARLARFFVHAHGSYRVRSELRDIILFAPHNLLQDPPFSRLDMVICRNVLIYLRRPMQQHVFRTFHYALRPRGFLFLGSSEAVDDRDELFEATEKRHRLYRRHHDSSTLPPVLPALPRTSAPAPAPLPAAPGPEQQHYLLLEEIGLPSVLVDEQYRVLHISETAWRYLAQPAGLPTEELLRLARPELQRPLQMALQHAFEHQANAQTPPVPVQFDAHSRLVTVLVRPSARRGRALVQFWESDETGSPAGARSAADRQDRQIAEFEHQLFESDQRLQITRQENQTSLEELRAANEELQSTNEEYRLALEELEISKEELQSMNEELQLVNQELKVRMEEVAAANGDLQNLFAATEIATLFLDRELRVKRFTPRAADLFNLRSHDLGRPIWHLRSRLDYPALEADVRQVLSSLIPIEHHVQAEDQRWYLVGLRPYRTVADKIDGVVVTGVDITANKANELALRRSEEQYRLLFESLEVKVAERTEQVRELVTQLTASEQEERRRISAILHDDLQQRLFSLNMQLAIVRQLEAEGALDEANQVIDDITAALQEAVEVTRSLSVTLSPPVLHDEGLPEAIRWLAALMQQQHGLAVTVEAARELPPLDEDVRVLLFQLVRELLFNVVKHAGVSAATVELAAADGALRIQVSDGGKGFDPSAQVGETSSQGLQRAEQRLQLIGGRVQVQSRPGDGTRVVIHAPLHNGTTNVGGAQPMNG
jgi:two-component system, chemotaxis family, CheB/CheR fusion protein